MSFADAVQLTAAGCIEMLTPSKDLATARLLDRCATVFSPRNRASTTRKHTLSSRNRASNARKYFPNIRKCVADKRHCASRRAGGNAPLCPLAPGALSARGLYIASRTAAHHGCQASSISRRRERTALPFGALGPLPARGLHFASRTAAYHGCQASRIPSQSSLEWHGGV